MKKLSKKQNKKHIAIIGPFGSQIPPKKQGGIEWMVHYLVNGLMAKGYPVMLFAPKTTKTKANLVAVVDKPIADYKITDKTEGSRKLRVELSVLAQVKIELAKKKGQISTIFNHTVNGGVLADIEQTLKVPTFHILHLPLYKEIAQVYKHFNARLISISNSQRKPFPDLRYAATIYNGIDLTKFPFGKKSKGYFLFAGKIRDAKNPLGAITAANMAKQKLIIAGRINDKQYHQDKIIKLLDKNIQYVGEVNFAEIKKLYSGATAFLFPIKWEEPFGLVMIEAMACGTPVIAFNNGSVPEVVKHNQTGFIVKNTKQMAQAMGKVGQLSRQECREFVKKTFSVERMIDEYEKLYLKTIKK